MRRLRGSRRFEGTYGSRSATPSMREKRYEAIPRKARYCRDTSARSTDRRPLLVPDPADQGAASVWPRIISWFGTRATARSEEHTSELQSLMRISYAVFCLKKQKKVPHFLQDAPHHTKLTNILTQ